VPRNPERAALALKILVAKGTIKTLRRFCASLRATLNLVAKGGIEPPTQGFSVLCSTN
jgi:hypothetical protein